MIMGHSVEGELARETDILERNLCPTNPTLPDLGSNTILRVEKPATNRLNYGKIIQMSRITAKFWTLSIVLSFILNMTFRWLHPVASFRRSLLRWEQ
jgi:hypothetical protein